MSEHKGAITLIIATLVLFSAFVAFGNDYITPLLGDVGTQFTGLVDSVFSNTSVDNPNVTP